MNSSVSKPTHALTVIALMALSSCDSEGSGGFWGNIGEVGPVHCDAVEPLDSNIALASSNAEDARPFFSFFITSQHGLYSLDAGNMAPAPNPIAGFGGDFGGLGGADEICTRLARASNPRDTKTWRAFLSTSGQVSGERVDAIERIGSGPWYDYNGRLFASNLRDLLPVEGGRPLGGDARLREMFTDENGEDARLDRSVDNHDTLTGSDQCGRLYDDGEAGVVATCDDWTSNTRRGLDGNLAGIGGQIPVGHSWPRDAFGPGPDGVGAHWISDHTVNGCEAGYDIDGGFGAPAGDYRVGAGGGYGGFYCFALGAVAPE